MGMFDVWGDYGFRQNPYSQETLGPDEEGDALLVGRDPAVRELQRKIGSGGAHPSVEGPVGVGKTSLINVASYRMYQQSLAAKAGELYLPAVERFQLSHDLSGFEATVFRVVAQTLIQHAKDLEAVGLTRPELGAIDRWLNSPQYSSGGLSATILGNGGQVTRGIEPNTSTGFAESGFREAVLQALRVAFPKGTGGVVCVLDNLEVVETVGTARSSLDTLRDPLFNGIPQLRWVLCGSRGLVSRARTDRLSAVFQAPMVVGPLDDQSAISAIRSRIEFFGVGGAEPPVTPEGFEYIYRALNSNLRDALATSQEFAHWLANEHLAEGKPVPVAEDREALLEAWLATRAESAFKDARDVQARHWQLFEALCASGGRAGSGEFERFGFGFQQQMVSSVSALADANLVVRESDPENGAKTVNSVTALGWLVYHYSSHFTLPPGRGRNAKS